MDALTQTEFNDAHLLLAIAYVRLGRLADARAEVVHKMSMEIPKEKEMSPWSRPRKS